MSDERLQCLEDRVKSMEEKIDTIMEMVYLGKHLAAFAKVLGWVGGAYISIETYLRTMGHK